MNFSSTPTVSASLGALFLAVAAVTQGAWDRECSHHLVHATLLSYLMHS